MTIFIDRFDSVPLQETEFPAQFDQWLSNLVDTLNRVVEQIQNEINTIELTLASGIRFPAFTEVEITALAVDAPNGTGWYCNDSTPPVIVVKENDILYKISTTTFP